MIFSKDSVSVNVLFPTLQEVRQYDIEKDDLKRFSKKGVLDYVCNLFQQEIDRKHQNYKLLKHHDYVYLWQNREKVIILKIY